MGASTSIIGGAARKLKSNATSYFGALGAPAKATTTESRTQWTMPVAGTLSNLRIRLSANAGDAGASYTFTVRVNGASPVGTVIGAIAGAISTCSDVTNSVAYSAGDLLSIEATPSSPEKPSAADVQWTAIAAGS